MVRGEGFRERVREGQFVGCDWSFIDVEGISGSNTMAYYDVRIIKHQSVAMFMS